MKNSGASFGIDFVGLNIVSVVMLMVIFLIWKKDKNVGWLLIILGGGLNLIERVVFGSVNDYWKIPFTNIYNNINDYLVFFGGIIVIWKKLR
jgi:lipoprotein signal peptidase